MLLLEMNRRMDKMQQILQSLEQNVHQGASSFTFRKRDSVLSVSSSSGLELIEEEEQG